MEMFEQELSFKVRMQKKSEEKRRGTEEPSLILEAFCWYYCPLFSFWAFVPKSRTVTTLRATSHWTEKTLEPQLPPFLFVNEAFNLL